MHDEVTLSWRLAVEHIELARGLSHGAAHKALLDACRKGKIKSEQRLGDWPDVSEADFWRWLNPPRPEVGKQPLVIKYLTEMFPNGVPAPALCQRKGLLGELQKLDPLLASLDIKTLKQSIDRYNSRQAGPEGSGSSRSLDGK